MTRARRHAAAVATALASHTIAGLPHPGHCELTLTAEHKLYVRDGRTYMRSEVTRHAVLDGLIRRLDGWQP